MAGKHRFYIGAGDVARLFLMMVLSGLLLGDSAVGGFVYGLFYALKQVGRDWSADRKNGGEQAIHGTSVLTVGFALIVSLIFIYTVFGASSWIFFIFTSIAAVSSSLEGFFSRRKKAQGTALSVLLALVLSGIFVFAAYIYILPVSRSGFWILSSLSLVAELLGALFPAPETPGYVYRGVENLSLISAFMKSKTMSVFSSVATWFGGLLVLREIMRAGIYRSDRYTSYTVCCLWVGMVFLMYLVCAILIRRFPKIVRGFFYVVGMACWILGFVFLLQGGGMLKFTLSSLLWAFGLAAMRAVVKRMGEDFILIAEIDGKEVPKEALSEYGILISVSSVSIAVILFGVLLLVEDVFSFPLGGVAFALPLVLMFASLVMLARQPLDERSRERIIAYFAMEDDKRTEQMRERIRSIFVRKSHQKFLIKLIMFIVRIFMPMKVIGKENIDKKSFPSIFVCNHGQEIGPIVATVYMPVYYRPWIQDKMIKRDLIEDWMYAGTFSKWKTPKGFNRFVTRLISGPVCWALNSFEPISVARGDMRKAMETMIETVKALQDGDNVLLFPEDPSQNENGEYSTQDIGALFTGFAHIGKMYYDATGIGIKFYPIYGNKNKHTFRIGEPIQFDTTAPTKTEKKRVSEELEKAMRALK